MTHTNNNAAHTHTGYLRCLFLHRTKRHPPATTATMTKMGTTTMEISARLEVVDGMGVVGGRGVGWLPGPPEEVGGTTFLLGVRRQEKGIIKMLTD